MKLGDLLNPKQYALKVLEMFLHKQCDLKRTEASYSQSEVWNAVNMAKEALEKQIPKKIVKMKIPNTSFCKAGTRYKCPSCGEKLCADWKFCFECGQALDWSEEND